MQRTLLQILKKATDYLARQQVASARLDAEVLLANILNVERIQLYVQFDRPMSQDELDRYKRDLIRRARGVPVAYITGVREFMSLPLKVGPGLLIPRPDTEVLVEQAIRRLEACRGQGRPQPRVIDAGTGSGAIACAIAHYAPWCQVLATDLSADALRYASENVRTLGLEDRVTLVCGDLVQAVPPGWTGATMVVSNPPYIASSAVPSLQKEIRHEPAAALDGGPDGLHYYRRLAQEAPAVLAPGGWLLLEVGDGQADQVRSILASHGWSDLEVMPDYAGTPRVVVARMKGGEGVD